MATERHVYDAFVSYRYHEPDKGWVCRVFVPALAALSAEQQAITRRNFLRLIEFGERRADKRRQQPESTLRAAGQAPKHFPAALRHLVDAPLPTVCCDEGVAPRGR
jgi:hypothetical protein